MYTYESTEQGDLSFQQGEIVVVTRKEGDWWTGTTGGRTGVFPSNYVKPRDSASEVILCPNGDLLGDLKLRLSKLCFFFVVVVLVFGISGEDGQPGKETR